MHKYQDEVETLRARDIELRDTVDKIKDQMTILEREAYNERKSREKAEQEFSSLRDAIESEVILRMQFEDKLNNMHAMNRDLKITNTTLSEEYEKQKSQLTKANMTVDVLTQEKDNLIITTQELESKCKQMEDKLKSVGRELDTNMNSYKRDEQQLTKIRKEFEAQQQ